MAGARSAAPQPASRATAAPIRRPRSPSISRIRGRTTTPRPNSTPRAGRSRWCRCPASGRVWSGWSSPPRPNGSRRSTTPRSTTRSNALAFDPRQDHGRARPRRLSARGRDRARVSARNRIALVGEAAHLIPPIGAQGLNLGLRDAATIGELVVAARRDGGDVGARRSAGALRQRAPRRREEPDAGDRPAQPHAAVGFPAGAEARAGSASI